MANWRYTLHLKDAFVDDASELNEEQIVALAHKFADRMKAFVNKLSANNEIRYEMQDVIEEMTSCKTVEEIDEVLYTMYDVCDSNRIWVK